jgi:diaminopimelate epimerase
MKLQFIKMHALGNDFVVIDDRESKLKKLQHLSKKLCNRRFGIGADQLLILCHSDKADFGMRTFNADGSEVEMCGNGIRCLGKYIWDHILRCDESAFAKKYCQSIDSIYVETPAGIMSLHKTRNLFKVNMGEPVLIPDQIPVNINQLPKKLKKSAMLQYQVKVKNRTYKINCVSMGNPHAIVIVKNIKSILLDEYGPLIENHSFFPNRTNVEFIQIIDQNNIKMRVWERGAGETLACGTGASASVVASSLLGLTQRKVNVHLPGGKLAIQWSEKDNHVYMTGPAITVFYGRIEI